VSDLSIAVQHHPSRQHLLGPLLARLGECEIVSDPDPDGKPSPLRCYLEALRRTPSSASHRLVVQDDTWPVSDFRAKAESLLEERPDGLVCFFVPGSAGGGMNRVRRASIAGERWARLGAGGWIPAVATCWPCHLIDPFLEFAAHPKFVKERADDGMIARFVKHQRRALKIEVWATVPSLVEHPDLVPSLIGKRHGAGTIRWRVAALFDDS
jgi:hypothetical protein